MSTPLPHAGAAGRFTFPGTTISVNRMGYGAMQLAGPHVFGDPKDSEEARAVLRETQALGIDHIDTSDFYGPHVTNRLIRDVLHPYDDRLTIITKVGFYRDKTGAWLPKRDADFLRRSVEENLENLGLEQLAVVNLRMEGPGDDIETPMRAMQRMQDEGLIAHIGVSTVDGAQLRVARDLAPVVCVQNHYNLVHRTDDDMIDALADDGIAYVPFFPLGGFTPLQADQLSAVASELGRTPQAVALAWLLQRSPNILVIPGTSKRVHLHANVEAGSIELAPEHLRRLENIRP